MEQQISSIPGYDTDKELQQFVEIEQQKARFHAQVHKFTEMCWDKCIDKPGNRLEAKEEACLTQCVERFLDSTHFIVNRLDEIRKQQ
ncbi:hypothetical protein CAOG_03610 [Capsaspora owczarzaki ATCC 30864]|uniref:Mitochondrial import inner membrane translocase subunit n=1 Tax=Capsaspora owczarzaki (strain ATCC 30864) TaxID=595528 RepID=A0A0D2WNJ1_CAPO3|nr:hypothetical protein CAOG_03610 [Capsaspora owczarzaki ATCC 30864]KJE92695.1 hypothetical protein CAOG_003610 [Capsaspora owczarzaki ATCC 30864]|eukprot:XP_004363338.1 hypothetical protein CAOG_03610 [Capsaspora owczarzaki ATCC 30864]